MTCGTATLNTSFTEGEKEILLPVEESTTLESDDSGGSEGGRKLRWAMVVHGAGGLCAQRPGA